MKLESQGILISLIPFNERDAVARVFTRDYGVLVGMLRGALGVKKNRPLVGQFGNVVWGARLDSQLGIFHWESEKNYAANLMNNADLLIMMNSAFSLLDVLLPEREEYQILYNKTLLLLDELFEKKSVAYLDWEITLLRELGYALDLSHCSGCGVTENLNYLSPRTARAVCDKCAAPYIDKLYTLPVNLNITLRFLENICMQQGGKMPIMRTMIKNI